MTNPLMNIRLHQFLIAIALIVGTVTGCATPPPVTISAPCGVPERLDYEAKGPDPLASVDTPLAKHLQDEANERGAHTKLAGDYNALREHLKGCH